MNKLAIAALVLTTSGGCFNGCQKKKESEAIEPAPPISSQPEAPAKALTGEELAQRAITCWGFYSDGKWDDLKGCYAPDATLVDLSNGAIAPGTGIEKGTDQIVAGNQKGKVG